MDDRYTIETPEQITFGYDVAGIGSRFLAAFLDTTLIVLLWGGATLALFMIGARLSSVGTGLESLIIAVWAIVSFVIIWGYYLAFELLWNGQSPGKRLVGLRVVREGGRPITFAASAIRNLIRIIDFLPALYGIGVLVMFIDQRSRRLGDFAAGSLVVRERRTVTLESLTARAAAPVNTPIPAHIAETAALPGLHLIAENDYELVQEFLRRRSELNAESRSRLGTRLADSLRIRMGLPPGGNPELFLENLASEYRLGRQRTEEQI